MTIHICIFRLCCGHISGALSAGAGCNSNNNQCVSVQKVGTYTTHPNYGIMYSLPLYSSTNRRIIVQIVPQAPFLDQGEIPCDLNVVVIECRLSATIRFGIINGHLSMLSLICKAPSCMTNLSSPRLSRNCHCSYLGMA